MEPLVAGRLGDGLNSWLARLILDTLRLAPGTTGLQKTR
jgi:hypothetical protein